MVLLKLVRQKAIRTALYVLGGIVALWLLNTIVVPLAVIHLKTNHLKQVFAQQVKLLSGPIASLGITGSPATQFQCSGDQGTNHWTTKVICESFTNYPYSSNSYIKPAYRASATKLDHLLQESDWINDSPRDSPVNLAFIASINVGAYTILSVPFHKNLGGISCNLEIGFSSVGASLTTSTGSLDVNEFSCSEQHIIYPEIRLSVPQYRGV
jgi:hypothetical protein